MYPPGGEKSLNSPSPVEPLTLSSGQWTAEILIFFESFFRHRSIIAETHANRGNNV
jgi:hypothetical protein